MANNLGFCLAASGDYFFNQNAKKIAIMD